MNGRQAAKLAAKRIEELEDTNLRYAHDVRRLYQVIESMIDGKSVCDWCEDKEECEEKTGCQDFLLKLEDPPANTQNIVTANMEQMTVDEMMTLAENVHGGEGDA